MTNYEPTLLRAKQLQTKSPSERKRATVAEFRLILPQTYSHQLCVLICEPKSRHANLLLFIITNIDCFGRRAPTLKRFTIAKITWNNFDIAFGTIENGREYEKSSKQRKVGRNRLEGPHFLVCFNIRFAGIMNRSGWQKGWC